MHAHPALHNYTLNLDDLTYKRQPCKFSDFASLSLLTPCTCSRVIPLAELVAPLEQEHGQTKIDGYDQNKQLDRISD